MWFCSEVSNFTDALLRFSLDSIVCIVTKLQTGGSGIFLISKPSRSSPAVKQPPSQWVTRSFPKVKRPGCEVHYSTPSSTEVENVWSYTSTQSLYCLRGVDRKALGSWLILLNTNRRWEETIKMVLKSGVNVRSGFIWSRLGISLWCLFTE